MKTRRDASHPILILYELLKLFLFKFLGINLSLGIGPVTIKKGVVLKLKWLRYLPRFVELILAIHE